MDWGPHGRGQAGPRAPDVPWGQPCPGLWLHLLLAVWSGGRRHTHWTSTSSSKNRENHPAFRRKCPSLVNTYCLCFPFPGRDTGSPRWLTERPRVAERGPGDRCHCGEGRRAAVARAVGRERVSVYLERPSKEQRLSMDNREIKSESNGHL